MRKHVAACTLAIAALTGPAAAAHAQEPAMHAPAVAVVTENATDDGGSNAGKWGLAGLAGLLGLAGLAQSGKSRRAGSSRLDDHR